jgi:high-affinity Fe2+/Pb2+ permease
VGFPEFLERVISYAQSHTVVVIILALIVLFFLYRKLKLLFVLLILGLFLAGLFYMITSMAGSGSEQKKKLIPREETQSERSP